MNKKSSILRNEDKNCRANDKILCTLCDVYYSRSNRIKHTQTRAHRRLQERSELIKTIIEEQSTKPKILSCNKFKEYLAIKEIKKTVNE